MLNPQRGQGLIESLIAMLIIFGTVVALMSFQATLAYNDSISTETSDATILVSNQLEILRDYQVLNIQSPYNAYQSIASGSSNTVGMDTTFQMTWTVTSYTNPTYKALSVVATWTDRRGISHSVTMATDVAGIDPSFSSSIM